MKWLNPLNWPTLATQIVGVALLVCGLGWYANYKLRQYYTADLTAAVKASQVKAEAENLKREAANLKQRNEALDAKTKTLAKNLANANAAAASASRLRDSIRASESAATDLTACLQHARAVSGVLATIDAFAGRLAIAADGHAADAVACHDAWPK